MSQEVKAEPSTTRDRGAPRRSHARAARSRGERATFAADPRRRITEPVPVSDAVGVSVGVSEALVISECLTVGIASPSRTGTDPGVA